MISSEEFFSEDIGVVMVRDKAILAQDVELVNAGLAIGHVHAFDDFAHEVALLDVVVRMMNS